MNELIPRKSNRLKDYNPSKGLKTIAVAEAAEKHFARAKDAEKLFEAIEVKLKAQAEFVLWWDGQDKKHYGQGSRNGSVTTKQAGKDGIPERMVLSRWRQLLDEAKLVNILAASRERCRRVCEMDRRRDSELVQQSLSNEHYTPEKYIEAARLVLGGIDLDPASCEEANKAVKATKFFNENQNGLMKSWNGRVWLNPPYGEWAAEFVEKLQEEMEAGNVTAAVVLVNAHCTDTAWFNTLWDGVLCFTDHRINFYGDEKRSGSTHGSVFVYFGDNKARFNEVFSRFGAVVVRMR